MERLAEFHDVQAALAQRRTDGRAGIGLPGLDLQLDVTDDFLCHCSLLLRVRTPARLAPAGLLAFLPVRTTRSGGWISLQGRLQPSLQARVRPCGPVPLPVPD